MESSTKKESSRIFDDLPPVLEHILNLLSVNPTSKYIIQKTNKDKRIVARDINRLIKLNRIKRIDRGLYKVIKESSKPQATPPSHQECNSSLLTDDRYFRLHNLQLCLRLNQDSYNLIKNTVYSNKQMYNLHPFGNAGEYFEYEVTGLITKQNIFIFFPEDFEVRGNDMKGLTLNLHSTIMSTFKKWESRFNVTLSKSGRFNFDIRNIHIAVVDKDVARELDSRNIDHLVVTDDDDGKKRFVIDMSKGFPEIECVHPQKAFDDSDQVKYLLEKTGEGKVREIINTYPGLVEMFGSFIASQTKVNNDFNNFILLEIAKLKGELKPIEPEEPKVRPDYVG